MAATFACAHADQFVEKRGTAHAVGWRIMAVWVEKPYAFFVGSGIKPYAFYVRVTGSHFAHAIFDSVFEVTAATCGTLLAARRGQPSSLSVRSRRSRPGKSVAYFWPSPLS